MVIITTRECGHVRFQGTGCAAVGAAERSREGSVALLSLLFAAGLQLAVGRLMTVAVWTAVKF